MKPKVWRSFVVLVFVAQLAAGALALLLAPHAPDVRTRGPDGALERQGRKPSAPPARY
jgi:hypothetical protein